MAAYRHLKRIAVAQAIFEWEFYEEKKDLLEELPYAYQETMNFARSKAKEIAGQEYEEEHFDVDEWTIKLAKGVKKEIKKIRKILTKYAPEWPLPKIASVDRAILYVGIYELIFSNETPEIVVINEAVEVAKSYGGKNSSKFINGVLNSVYKQEKKVAPPVEDNKPKNDKSK